jgi:hypothetical protein
LNFTHKAGSDSGVDYAAVVVLLLWIAMTIVLVVLLLLRGNAAALSDSSPQLSAPLWSAARPNSTGLLPMATQEQSDSSCSLNPAARCLESAGGRMGTDFEFKKAVD